MSGKSQSTGEDKIFYPLRRIGNWWSFCSYLFLLPVGLTMILFFILSSILFKHSGVSTTSFLTLTGTLFLLLIALWIPNFLAIYSWPTGIEIAILVIRNIFILWLIHNSIPFPLLAEKFNHSPTIENWLKLITIGILVGVFVISIIYHFKTAAYEVREGTEPRHRRLTERWLVMDSFYVLGVLIALILIFSNFFLYGNEIVKTSTAIKNAILGEKRDFLLSLLLLFCGSLLLSLVFFLLGVLPDRVMKSTLISVTFHERDVKGIIKNSNRYYTNFIQALFFKHPIIIPGGALLTLAMTFIPVFLICFDGVEYLNKIAEADEIILALVIFFSWFAPLVLAVVKIDETFGEFFNNKIADLLMRIQRHIVLIGFGSLGKRVLDRQVRILLSNSKWKRYFPHFPRGSFTEKFKKDQAQREKVQRSFFLIVTPDLQLELVSTEFVVIEKDPVNVIYSTSNDLLGMYGVVSCAETLYKSRLDSKHNIILHPEVRVLVPVVVGEAKEPFINSRVNLERARLMISTVPDGETVRAVFERALKNKIPSIVCVRHSDQISYLTYRSRHHQVILVYPRHNQGNTLGYRMWASMLKVRSIEKMKRDEWPNVLIIGNNKANRFMLETLWTFLPGIHDERKQILNNHFAFLVTPGEKSIGYPVLKDARQSHPTFDLFWPESFVTSGRFPYPISPKKKLRPQMLKTRMINDVDTRAIIESLWEHRPHIILINHDKVENVARMLLRCMRAIERLKHRIKNFQMPIILLSAAQADEKEHLTLGDASRYYDALCRLYKEKVASDHRYPGHSRYDHYVKEIIGESITDSHADAEEMIIGAIRAYQEPETERFWRKMFTKGVQKVSFVKFTLDQLNDIRAKLNQKITIDKDEFCNSELKNLINAFIRELSTREFPEQELWNRIKPILIDFEVLLKETLELKGCNLNESFSIVNLDNDLKEWLETKKLKTEKKEIQPSFIEVSSCLPNRAGALADYISDLAKLAVNKYNWEELSLFWKEQVKLLSQEVTEILPYVPSFQYLRHLKQDDPEHSTFALTGYATLTPINEHHPLFSEKTSDDSPVVRIFANDGRNYVERFVDPLEEKESPGILTRTTPVELIKEPTPPGVPDVIDRVARRGDVKFNKISEYKDVLMGNFSDSEKNSTYLCPGMNSCRIAAFQDYINASNNLRFELMNKTHDFKLWHARNYFCTKNSHLASEEDIPTEKSYFARIICCAHEEYGPGLIAKILNMFIFRRPQSFDIPKGSIHNNWQINIDYFKHITCQNKYFTLNRLFGKIELPKNSQHPSNTNSLKIPLQLLRIIPFGDIDSAKYWYTYSWVLWKFLNTPSEDKDAKPLYNFSWINGQREGIDYYEQPNKENSKFYHPNFATNSPENIPIAIMIKKSKVEVDGEKLSVKCRLCGVVDEQYDCRKIRAWL